MKRLFAKLSLCLLALTLCLSTSSAQGAIQNYERQQIMMGDVPVAISVRTQENRRLEAIEAMSQAFAIARRLEQVLSEWQPESDISQLNQAAGRFSVPLQAESMNLLEQAEEMKELSAGYFDITFASKTPEASRLSLQLNTSKREAFLPHQDMRIGVSGIAKGYIVDQMATILRKRGFSTFMINAGGDIWAENSPSSEPWSIALEKDPFDRNSLLCFIRLSHRAIASSGRAQRGDHLVLPPTVKKPNQEWAASTVIADDATTADALATAFALAGSEGPILFKEIHDKRPNIQVIITKKDKTFLELGVKENQSLLHCPERKAAL